jgi:hypothetical protein
MIPNHAVIRLAASGGWVINQQNLHIARNLKAA